MILDLCAVTCTIAFVFMTWVVIRDSQKNEVVRCKDCKHYVLHALACRNEHMNGVINIDGFCSYGERKEG